MSEQMSKISGGRRPDEILIFVVDDEPMLVELTSVILKPLGYEVRTFLSADDALAEIQRSERCPDLIITDYAMHHLTGMDLLDATRRLDPRQKVMLVSGTVGEEIYADSALKPDAFLPKPYQAKDIIAAVKSLLAQ
jgi:CheY-like chemotaxis protein